MGQTAGNDDRYQLVALANTTAAQFVSQLDGSIVIIALPAIFRGIGLDPLSAGNIAYLHSFERILPKLGETTTSAEILKVLATN